MPLMKYLTLIRHAKSDWGNATLPDHDRPLNERGLRSAPVVGRFLAKTYFGQNGTPALLPLPDGIVSSTALRALTTAQLLQPEFGSFTVPLFTERRLYLADPRTMLAITRELSDNWKHVVMVGHNPGISECADKLLKRGGVDEMPTCAAAIIEVPWESWAAVDWNEARLVGFITPRLIERRFPDPGSPPAELPPVS